MLPTAPCTADGLPSSRVTDSWGPAGVPDRVLVTPTPRQALGLSVLWKGLPPAHTTGGCCADPRRQIRRGQNRRWRAVVTLPQSHNSAQHQRAPFPRHFTGCQSQTPQMNAPPPRGSRLTPPTPTWAYRAGRLDAGWASHAALRADFPPSHPFAPGQVPGPHCPMSAVRDQQGPRGHGAAQPCLKAALDRGTRPRAPGRAVLLPDFLQLGCSAAFKFSPLLWTPRGHRVTAASEAAWGGVPGARGGSSSFKVRSFTERRGPKSTGCTLAGPGIPRPGEAGGLPSASIARRLASTSLPARGRRREGPRSRPPLGHPPGCLGRSGPGPLGEQGRASQGLLGALAEAAPDPDPVSTADPARRWSPSPSPPRSPAAPLPASPRSVGAEGPGAVLPGAGRWNPNSGSGRRAPSPRRPPSVLRGPHSRFHRGRRPGSAPAPRRSAAAAATGAARTTAAGAAAPGLVRARRAAGHVRGSGRSGRSGGGRGPGRGMGRGQKRGGGKGRGLGGEGRGRGAGGRARGRVSLLRASRAQRRGQGSRRKEPMNE